MESSKSDNILISKTQKWVESFVIKHNLCPFAKHVFDTNKINYCLAEADKLDALWPVFLSEIESLDKSAAVSTSLIIISKGLESFDAYLDCLYVLETYLKDTEKDEDYQLASFHPLYQFSGTQIDAKENFTNRSPYPVFQILRTDEVFQAIETHGDIDRIPLDNIKKMNSLSDHDITDF